MASFAVSYEHVTTMWIPKPVYNSLPAIYIVIGLLIAAGVTYIGLERKWSMAYLALAALCIAAGIIVQWMRIRARQSAASGNSSGLGQN